MVELNWRKHRREKIHEKDSIPQQLVDGGIKAHPKHKGMKCMDGLSSPEFHIFVDKFAVSTRWKWTSIKSLRGVSYLSKWSNLKLFEMYVYNSKPTNKQLNLEQNQQLDHEIVCILYWSKVEMHNSARKCSLHN